MTYAIDTTLDLPFDDAVAAVRAALAEQGFGVLTEIDMSGTLERKLGVTIPRQLILGACNPPLAHRALEAEPAIGLLLPCNVVVRTADDGRTAVAALDPTTMVQVTGNDELTGVAQDAGDRLRAALATLT